MNMKNLAHHPTPSHAYETPKQAPSGTYDGAELRKFTGRPGSMDAYALPSRDGDTFVKHTGPKPMLVGKLADPSSHGW
jgi:hypothetical protein